MSVTLSNITFAENTSYYLTWRFVDNGITLNLQIYKAFSVLTGEEVESALTGKYQGVNGLVDDVSDAFDLKTGQMGLQGVSGAQGIYDISLFHTKAEDGIPPAKPTGAIWDVTNGTWSVLPAGWLSSEDASSDPLVHSFYRTVFRVNPAVHTGLYSIAQDDWTSPNEFNIEGIGVPGADGEHGDSYSLNVSHQVVAFDNTDQVKTVVFRVYKNGTLLTNGSGENQFSVTLTTTLPDGKLVSEFNAINFYSISFKVPSETEATEITFNVTYGGFTQQVIITAFLDRIGIDQLTSTAPVTINGTEIGLDLIRPEQQYLPTNIWQLTERRLMTVRAALGTVSNEFLLYASNNLSQVQFTHPIGNFQDVVPYAGAIRFKDSNGNELGEFIYDGRASVPISGTQLVRATLTGHPYAGNLVDGIDDFTDSTDRYFLNIGAAGSQISVEFFREGTFNARGDFDYTAELPLQIDSDRQISIEDQSIEDDKFIIPSPVVNVHSVHTVQLISTIGTEINKITYAQAADGIVTIEMTLSANEPLNNYPPEGIICFENTDGIGIGVFYYLSRTVVVADNSDLQNVVSKVTFVGKIHIGGTGNLNFTDDYTLPLLAALNQNINARIATKNTYIEAGDIRNPTLHDEITNSNKTSETDVVSVKAVTEYVAAEVAEINDKINVRDYYSLVSQNGSVGVGLFGVAQYASVLDATATTHSAEPVANRPTLETDNKLGMDDTATLRYKGISYGDLEIGENTSGWLFCFKADSQTNNNTKILFSASSPDNSIYLRFKIAANTITLEGSANIFFVNAVVNLPVATSATQIYTISAETIQSNNTFEEDVIYAQFFTPLPADATDAEKIAYIGASKVDVDGFTIIGYSFSASNYLLSGGLPNLNTTANGLQYLKGNSIPVLADGESFDFYARVLPTNTQDGKTVMEITENGSFGSSNGVVAIKYDNNYILYQDRAPGGNYFNENIAQTFGGFYQVNMRITRVGTNFRIWVSVAGTTYEKTVSSAYYTNSGTQAIYILNGPTNNYAINGLFLGRVTEILMRKGTYTETLSEFAQLTSGGVANIANRFKLGISYKANENATPGFQEWDLTNLSLETLSKLSLGSDGTNAISSMRGNVSELSVHKWASNMPALSVIAQYLPSQFYQLNPTQTEPKAYHEDYHAHISLYEGYPPAVGFIVERSGGIISNFSGKSRPFLVLSKEGSNFIIEPLEGDVKTAGLAARYFDGTDFSTIVAGYFYALQFDSTCSNLCITRRPTPTAMINDKVWYLGEAKDSGTITCTPYKFTKTYPMNFIAKANGQPLRIYPINNVRSMLATDYFGYPAYATWEKLLDASEVLAHPVRWRLLDYWLRSAVPFNTSIAASLFNNNFKYVAVTEEDILATIGTSFS